MKKRVIIAMILYIYILAFLGSSCASGQVAKRSQKTTNTKITEVTNDGSTSSRNSVPELLSETDTRIETSPAFSVTSENMKQKVGDISHEGDFYVGLDCIRLTKELQSAAGTEEGKVGSNQEVIYLIMQVFNVSQHTSYFDERDIALYADSYKASVADTDYTLSIDGYRDIWPCFLDSQKSSIVITAFIIEKGWKHIEIIYGNSSWSITSGDISSEPYEYISMFSANDHYLFTDEGSIVYEENYQLTFDGTEIYTRRKYSFEPDEYVMFKFTINNTSDTVLNYEQVGVRMRCYVNSRLLDGCELSIADDIWDGYMNVMAVDSIHPGMLVKVYVVFPLRETDIHRGVFECFFDTGHNSKLNTIAYVCSEIK